MYSAHSFYTNARPPPQGFSAIPPPMSPFGYEQAAAAYAHSQTNQQQQQQYQHQHVQAAQHYPRQEQEQGRHPPPNFGVSNNAAINFFQQQQNYEASFGTFSLQQPTTVPSSSAFKLEYSRPQNNQPPCSKPADELAANNAMTRLSQPNECANGNGNVGDAFWTKVRFLEDELHLKRAVIKGLQLVRSDLDRELKLVNREVGETRAKAEELEKQLKEREEELANLEVHLKMQKQIWADRLAGAEEKAEELEANLKRKSSHHHELLEQFANIQKQLTAATQSNLQHRIEVGLATAQVQELNGQLQLERLDAATVRAELAQAREAVENCRKQAEAANAQAKQANRDREQVMAELHASKRAFEGQLAQKEQRIQGAINLLMGGPVPGEQAVQLSEGQCEQRRGRTASASSTWSSPNTSSSVASTSTASPCMAENPNQNELEIVAEIDRQKWQPTFKQENELRQNREWPVVTIEGEQAQPFERVKEEPEEEEEEEHEQQLQAVHPQQQPSTSAAAMMDMWGGAGGGGGQSAFAGHMLLRERKRVNYADLINRRKDGGGSSKRGKH